MYTQNNVHNASKRNSIGTKATARNAKSMAFQLKRLKNSFTGPVTVFDDLAHSLDEHRLKGIEKTATDRSVLVVFTFRNQEGLQLIRPISTRYLHQEKIDYYEKPNLKPLPILLSDAETENFVTTTDLTKFDLSGRGVMHFEFEEKDSQLSMRVPTSLLDAVKSKAKLKKVPYTRYIRMLIERDISAR